MTELASREVAALVAERVAAAAVLSATGIEKAYPARDVAGTPDTAGAARGGSGAAAR